MEEAMKRLNEAMNRFDATVNALGDPTPPSPNCCQVCGGAHREDVPHRLYTPFYQDTFVREHGRAPTWADAIAHCSESMRKAWTTALKAEDAWSEPLAGVMPVANFGPEEPPQIGLLPSMPKQEPGCVSWISKAELEVVAKGENSLYTSSSALEDQITQRDIRISELEAYVDVLKASLQPFAAEGARWHESFADDERPHCLLPTMAQSNDTLAAFTLADLRRAAILEPKQ